MDRLYGNPTTKIFIICMLSFMIILGILVSLSSDSNVDVWGHVGGLIFGYFTFPILIKPIQENDSACCSYKYWFYLCIGVDVLFAIGGFLGFFLGK